MRTEEEKVAQASIVLVFGGVEYPVRPLVIRESREWRIKVFKAFDQLPRSIGQEVKGEDVYTSTITSLMVTIPDEIISLVFDYAKELDKEEIEAVATDGEMAAAFEQIMEVAFPLARSLLGAMTKLSR